MPIIKSAQKKMRKDKKRTLQNKKKIQVLKSLLKKAHRAPSAKLLSQVTSNLDRATKTNLIHKNKAARLKSRLAKILFSQA